MRVVRPATTQEENSMLIRKSMLALSVAGALYKN
jgi:hypothetical protein